MPNVQVHNLSLFTNNEKFTAFWTLTRALKTAGWRYKASSDGTSKDTTGNPANDKWGGGQQVGSQTGTAAMVLTNPSSLDFGGRQTVSGVTGATFTTSSPGHFLTITGASNSGNNGTFLITKYISATSVQIENPNGVAETTPGGATWKETSALLDTYAAVGSLLGAGAWLCLQGPSTIKVPIGSATPAFIKGENVVQSTTSATGEVIGVYTDSVNGGYLVISPRLSGSSSGVRGWDAAHVITGSVSGASVSPTGTLLEFVREVVFWRASTTTGHIYYQAIERLTEGLTTSTTGRFSTMAALATCTATICPGGATGGSPLTNGFPTVGTFVPGIGSGGSGAVGTNANDWFDNGNSATIGLAHLMCANCIEDTNTSADGSFTWVLGMPAQGNNVFQGCGFMRLDDQEDGDLDPFVWCVTNNPQSPYVRARTGGASTQSPIDPFGSSGAVLPWAGGSSSYLGHRRRGFPTGDSFSEFNGSLLHTYSVTTALAMNPGTPDRVACAFSNVPVREPIWVVNQGAGPTTANKTRKGTLRWWYYVQGGNGTNTYDNKKFIQLSSYNISVVAGPADGVTVPLSQ